MQTCNIMGVNIAVTDMDKTLRLVEDNCEAWRGKYICVANVHTTVTAHDDPTYLRVQNGAVMALPDGGPLSRYSRKKGFADAARVTALLKSAAKAEVAKTQAITTPSRTATNFLKLFIGNILLSSKNIRAKPIYHTGKRLDFFLLLW